MSIVTSEDSIRTVYVEATNGGISIASGQLQEFLRAVKAMHAAAAIKEVRLTVIPDGYRFRVELAAGPSIRFDLKPDGGRLHQSFTTQNTFWHPDVSRLNVPLRQSVEKLILELGVHTIRIDYL